MTNSSKRDAPQAGRPSFLNYNRKLRVYVSYINASLAYQERLSATLNLSDETICSHQHQLEGPWKALSGWIPPTRINRRQRAPRTINSVSTFFTHYKDAPLLLRLRTDHLSTRKSFYSNAEQTPKQFIHYSTILGQAQPHSQKTMRTLSVCMLLTPDKITHFLKVAIHLLNTTQPKGVREKLRLLQEQPSLANRSDESPSVTRQPNASCLTMQNLRGQLV